MTKEQKNKQTDINSTNYKVFNKKNFRKVKKFILTAIPAVTGMWAFSVWFADIDKDAFQNTILLFGLSLSCLFMVILIVQKYKNKEKISKLLISIKEEKRQQKNYKDFFVEFDNLLHLVKDSIKTFEEESKTFSLDDFKWEIRRVLNLCVGTFSNIHGFESSQCVASLMVKTLNDDNTYQTNMYDGNVPNERSIEPSGLVKYPSLVHRAFEYKKPQIWYYQNDYYSSTNQKKTDESLRMTLGFQTTRKNPEKFYKSGITVPIFVFGESAAVLNIDTITNTVFSHDDSHIAAGFGYALGIVIVSGHKYFDELQKNPLHFI